MESTSVVNRSRDERLFTDRGKQAYAKPFGIARPNVDADLGVGAQPDRRRWLALATGVLMSGIASPVFARRAVTEPDDRFAVAGTTTAQVRPFLASLQKAVAADERRAVTRMFFYPSRIWVGDRSHTALRRSDVSDRYDSIFDASLRRLIADAQLDTLWANWRGVALGDGRLWIARITTQDRLAITAINGPAGAAGPNSG